MKIPCGRVLGHGELCTVSYLCDSCLDLQLLLDLLTKAEVLLKEADRLAGKSMGLHEQIEALLFNIKEKNARQA